MKLTVVFLVLVVSGEFTGDAVSSKVANIETYRKDNPPQNLEESLPPTEADKTKIVELHNNYRRDVQPTATNMRIMVWDDKLAAFAQAWAETCSDAYEKYIYIDKCNPAAGQNVAVTDKDNMVWADVINFWYSGNNYFTYGQNNNQNNQKQQNDARAYARMVHASSHRVGCGAARCNANKILFKVTCNYNSRPASYLLPYVKGDSCASCVKACDDKLCDCGSRICLNDGVLDVSRCKCRCRTLYQGDECKTKKCPVRDPDFCLERSALKCQKHPSYRYDCPYLCGLCPA